MKLTAATVFLPIAFVGAGVSGVLGAPDADALVDRLKEAFDSRHNLMAVGYPVPEQCIYEIEALLENQIFVNATTEFSSLGPCDGFVALE